MLTNRLEKIKKNLEIKLAKSDSDIELLKIINVIDKVDDNISIAYHSNDSDILFEMIIKPMDNICSTCGKTLK